MESSHEKISSGKMTCILDEDISIEYWICFFWISNGSSNIAIGISPNGALVTVGD